MRGIVGLGLLAVTLSLARSGRAQCTMDTECKGDRVCEAGKCVSPNPAPSSASSDAATSPDAGPAANTEELATTPVEPAAPSAATVAPLPIHLDESPSSSELPPAPPPRDESRRRSKPALVTGIVMASAGPIALLGALAARNAQERCDNDLQNAYPNHALPTSERYRVDDCNAYSVPIYILGIGGALLTVVGVPLIIYGGKSVPAAPAAGHVQVLPWATPQAGGMKLRFTL